MYKEKHLFKIMTDFTPDINTLSKKDFIPSTITMKGIFSSKIDINILSNFLFVNHIFNKQNERVKLISGSRQSIEYFGPEGTIVFIGYKDIRRGMRTGAMNNMVSVDMQYGGKNIHIKLSSTSITSVGTSDIEAGKKVVNRILEHITDLQKYLDYSNSLSDEEKKKNIDWLIKELSDYEEGTREKDLLEEMKIPDELNERFIIFLLKYFNDHDKLDNYKKHIALLTENLVLSEKKVGCSKFNIFNSVYHIQPVKNPNFRMPLHKLAPFLAGLGVCTSFHNAISEGINVCFDVEEEKEGINHEDKFYKHRFTIHVTSKIRQSSPTCREEAYKYYLGMMNLLKLFCKQEDIDFKKYISEDIKAHDNVKILLKAKENVKAKANEKKK